MYNNFDMSLETLRLTLLDFLSKIVDGVPAFLGAIIVMALGLLVAWIGGKITLRIIRWLKLERLAERTPLKKFAKSLGYGVGIGELFSKLIYWLLFLVFLGTATQIIGLTEVSDLISSIFGYIPSIVGALIILILGAYIARVLRDTVFAIFHSANIAYAKLLGNGAHVLAFLFVIIIALNQLGFDTYILISNINIVIAGLALAFAISFGLAGRRTARNIIAMRYIRQLVRPDNRITSGKITGKIIKITGTGILVEDTSGNRHFIGADKLMQNLTIEV